MNIVIESLFQWDIKNQRSKGPGIFGTTIAFAPADEEQGRKTLHKHIQLWVKEIDHSLRAKLFDNDENTRTEARKIFQNYIDKIMCASYGVDLEIPIPQHPNSLESTVSPESLYNDTSPQQFRDARNENLCVPIDGRVIISKQSNQLASPGTIIDRALNYWTETVLEGSTDERLDTCMPPSKEKLDQAAYLYSYHIASGSNILRDKFWGDHRIRQVLLTQRFDHHDYTHRRGCFKKGCECRFLFPFTSCQETHIHEDTGDNNENVIIWHKLFGDNHKIAPWMIVPKRPMGCQYINVHNQVLSSILNCNTNVQIGDAFHMYYITLYNLKSTQEEDSEHVKHITESIIRRLVRIQDEISLGLRDEQTDESFTEGLCRLLSGMNAATARYVVSSTMAHLLISQGGTRFKFSHGLSDLLVTQLEACLEDKPVDFRLRINAYKGQKCIWRDCLADDYIHRPNQDMFENMCSYEMAMKYKKRYLSFRQMNKLNKNVFDNDDNEEQDDNYDYSPLFQSQFKSGPAIAFKPTHPGFRFSHLEELKYMVIPKISLPKNSLCDIEALDIGYNVPDEATSKAREEYAKQVLIMFYPYRTIDDIKQNGSYWSCFMCEYHKHSSHTHTKFWKKGFDILQNIQDRQTLEKELKRARDPVTLKSKCKNNTNKNNGQKPSDNYDTTPDILTFCPQYR